MSETTAAYIKSRLDERESLTKKISLLKENITFAENGKKTTAHVSYGSSFDISEEDFLNLAKKSLAEATASLAEINEKLGAIGSLLGSNQ